MPIRVLTEKDDADHVHQKCPSCFCDFFGSQVGHVQDGGYAMHGDNCVLDHLLSPQVLGLHMFQPTNSLSLRKCTT